MLPVVPFVTTEVKLLKIGRKDCFVFNFGCLVCWGCSQAEADKAKAALRPFLVEPRQTADAEEDNVIIGAQRDVPAEVRLSSANPPIFERLALAYALAQSVRLQSLEERIDTRIRRTRTIPETLAKTGNVDLSSKGVTQLMGELFVLRNQVNLHTDLLDTPDIFWEYADYEPLYMEFRAHLEVDRRIAILNQRFEVLQDLFDVLEDELNERHGSRLAWVVILLCALEALVMGLRLYARLHVAGTPEPDGGTAGDGNHSLAVLPILGPLGHACNLVAQRISGAYAPE